MIPKMFASMTRVSSVEDNHSYYDAIKQDKRSAAVDKNGTADSMLGQKSGPAAPATTALHLPAFVPT